jgi:hypothetical protein
MAFAFLEGFNFRNEDHRLMRHNLALEIAEFEWILAEAPRDQRAAYEARIERYKQYPLNVLQEEYNRLVPLVKRNVKYLAKRIAQLEWVAAGAPRDQRAAYEARIQRYEQYPLNVLEREYNRLDEGDDAPIAEALRDLAGEAVGEGVLPINAQVRAINDERRARARAFFGVWKDELTTDAAPHIGTKDVPEGSENFISRDDIEDGDEMVELHGNPAHIYKKSSLNQWISSRKEQYPRDPIKNPYTDEIIKQRNIKRYTAKIKKIGGITTHAAPHIGTRNIPEGSEDYITNETIEEGDEMVELHGHADHIYKKSSINQWISKRKEQFPRNPIKNPYTGEYINQENIKRYTAKLKTKPKNKDKNKNNAPKSGGACGYNRTSRKYGRSKKRKSLRVLHRSRKSQ